MKKLIIATAAVACASVVMAQTVTSQNIVGYTKVTASDSALSLVALNFTPGSTDVNDLIGAQLPVGTTLHIWDKTSGGYNSITYAVGRSGASWPAADLNIGDAFWIQVPAAGGSHEVILSGEVSGDALSTTIGGPIDATGYFYPVAATWGDTDLATQLPLGSTLHLWNGATYDSYTKATGRSGVTWSGGETEVIAPAQSFWVEAPATAWTEGLPYTP